MTWDRHTGGRSVPHSLQRACFTRDHHTCQQCGHHGNPGDSTLHADHIHNRATGGQNVLDNLVTLCTDCHARKTTHERAVGQAHRKARRQRPQRPHPGTKTPGG